MGLLFSDDCLPTHYHSRSYAPVDEEDEPRRVSLRPLRARAFPYWQRVIELMRTIEHSRDSLEALLSHSGTRRVWPQFLAAGGTSATDLEYWLAGQELDAPIRTKKHLRLVASRGLPRYRPIRKW
jgi:hypothetical protein